MSGTRITGNAPCSSDLFIQVMQVIYFYYKTNSFEVRTSILNIYIYYVELVLFISFLISEDILCLENGLMLQEHLVGPS